MSTPPPGAFRIQRIPRGLLELLQMRGTGDSPHSIQPEVQGGIELRELYAQDIRKYNGTGPVAVVAGLNIPAALTVPPSEQWVVSNVSVNAITGVGTNFDCVPIYNIPALGTFALFDAPLTIVASRNEFRGRTFEWGSLILPPGAILGTMNWNVVGASTVAVIVDYYRLPL